MASYSRLTFTAKDLISGIFKILKGIEPKAMNVNPNIKEDLERVKKIIEKEETIAQIKDEDLQKYKAVIDEIMNKKIDTTKIDTSKFRD